MDDKRLAQEALNRSLSGLKENPFLAQRVIAEAKGETKMKKHLSRGLILAVILTLAVVGTAYAAFSSQVAEFFGLHWNKELGEWLKGGKAAQVGESVTVGGVTFTLDEVVYRSRGLYGVGTARAADEKDTLIPFDWMGDPEFFEIYPEAAAYLRAAVEKGGRALQVQCMPRKIGVDGGTLLSPGSIGYMDYLNEDGSLTFAFEASDGFALQDGAVYTLQMDVVLTSIGADGTGEWLPTPEDQEWLVQCEPTLVMEETEKPQEPVNTADVPKDGYTLLLPEAYKETGTMPVYRALAPDFSKLLQLDTIDASGVKEHLTGGTEGHAIFQDGGQLYYGAEYLHFSIESEELYDYNTRAREEDDPSIEPDIRPMQSLATAIGYLAASADGFHLAEEPCILEREALTHISLNQAKEKAEALLSSLGIRGFECSYALDMSADRIHALGDAYNRLMFEGTGYTNSPQYDYNSAGPEEEGYYLEYCLLGVDRANEGRFEMAVYITEKGIALCTLRSDFVQGEALYTPETLITPEKAVERLYEEVARSHNSEPVNNVQRVALTYAAARAENPKDGMVFVPVWQVLYQDESGARQNYVSSAEFSAIDGTLLNAPFQ